MFPPSQPLWPKWSKSYLSRNAKRCHLLSHVRIKYPKFYASYEKNPCPPNMYCLLQHAYGRIWFQENIRLQKEIEQQNRRDYDPLEKARAAVKAKKEREQRLREEQERIALRLKGVKRNTPKENLKCPVKK